MAESATQFILFVSHGSRSKEAGREVMSVLRFLQDRFTQWRFKAAFLDVQEPAIPAAIDQCAQAGAQTIVVVPNFLNAGAHVLRDIPDLIDSARKKYSQIKFALLPHLGAHEALSRLYVEILQCELGRIGSNETQKSRF